MYSDPTGYGRLTIILSKEFLRDLVKNGITFITAIVVEYICSQIPALNPFKKILITASSTFILCLIGGWILRYIKRMLDFQFDYLGGQKP